jgi:hypothetical protein
LARDYRGREELLLFLALLASTGFWLREYDVLGNDVHVCALSETGARRPRMVVSTRVVSIFHFRDGRQVERWLPRRQGGLERDLQLTVAPRGVHGGSERPHPVSRRVVGSSAQG